MPTTILLVDDHPVFRKGLRLLFEEEQDMSVIGEAGDGQEAIEQVRDLSPDAVVMDITMPNFNGIDATRQIVSESPDTKVLALSIHSGRRFIEDMMSAGAAGYILKECVPEELVNGVRAVMRGEIFLSPSVTGIVVSEFVKGGTGSQASEEHDGWTSDETIPIIRTKLHRPPIPEDHVHRPQLLEQLEKGRHGQLTLVSAPAGYGKSILLSCWLKNCDCPNAWFSVDESDNNLRQFLIYFLAAIRTMFPDAVEKTLALANTGSLPPLKVLAGGLLNEMNLIDQGYILALDDIHLIQEQQVHELLTEMLRHPPQRMHLVLSGRRDPFLPISSFRARGLLTEIRVRDLCFTTTETKAYLQQALGGQIEDAIASEWTEKTEGWITGLHLAALSMRQRGDAASMLPELPGGIQYVMEYLFNEVFLHQSPEIRHFLMSTAILDRFCTPLCDVVSGPDVASGQDDTHSRGFLNLLKKQNLFVVNLDAEDHWFRFHHLFHQLLRNQLERLHSPEEISELHSRAGQWFAEKGFIDEAIRHLLAAGDLEKVVELIKQNRQIALDEDKWHVFDKWLSMLPKSVVLEQPELLLGQAWILLMLARVAEILPIVERVEALFDEDSTEPALLSEINFFQGLLCYFQGESARSVELFTKAMELLPKGAFIALRAQAEYWACVALHLNGRKETAIRRLHLGIRSRDLQDGMMLSRLTFGLCFIHMLNGEWLQAFQEGLRLGEVSRSNRLAFAETWAMYVQGNASFQMFDLDAARHHFSLVVENRYIANHRAAVDAMAGLAITCQFMGKPDEADETIRLAQEYAKWTKAPGHLEIVRSCQARLALLRGDLDSASRWQRALSETPGNLMMLFFLEIPVITECRVLIAIGSDAGLKEAIEKLEDLRLKSKAWHNTCQMTEIMVLQALASQRQGRLDESLDILERTVTMAEPGGSIRPFFEPGAVMIDLLTGLKKQHVSPDFIDQILAAVTVLPVSPSPDRPLPGSPPPQPLVEPLTNREIDILEMLDERLQNKEIADKFFISPETVKSHLKNIFQKLNAKNRRQAVQKAKNLGIL